MPSKTSEWTTITKPSRRTSKKEAEAVPAAETTTAPSADASSPQPKTPDASTTLKNLLGVVPLDKQQQQQPEKAVVAEAVARASSPPTAEQKKVEVKAKQKKQAPFSKKATTKKATPAPAPEEAAGPSSSSAPSSSASPSVRAAPSSLCVAQVRLEQDQGAESENGRRLKFDFCSCLLRSFQCIPDQPHSPPFTLSSLSLPLALQTHATRSLSTRRSSTPSSRQRLRPTATTGGSGSRALRTGSATPSRPRRAARRRSSPRPWPPRGRPWGSHR